MPKLKNRCLHNGYLHQDQNRPKAMGFTLLEILVVLVMVGILSAIAAPSWLSFSINQSLNSAQSRAFSTLRLAQSNAKRDQVDWQASFRNFGDRAQYAMHKTPTSYTSDSAYWNSLPWENFDGAVVIVENAPGGYPNTTFSRQSPRPTPDVYRARFTYKGNADGIGEQGKITFAPRIGDRRKCVIVSTILGSIRLAEGSGCN